MLKYDNMWEQFKQFCTNPILVACLFSWFCAQFIKTIIKLIYGKIHTFRELIELLVWRTGGLPSSHSALVTCLTTCIGMKNGINSDLFMLSFGFCLITIRDALGVRRSSGVQASTLNEIGKQLDSKEIIEYVPIKEVQGHSPMEVVLGCILGFFIGLAFNTL